MAWDDTGYASNFALLVPQEWGRSFGALFSIFGCLIQTIVLQRVIDLSKD